MRQILVAILFFLVSNSVVKAANIELVLEQEPALDEAFAITINLDTVGEQTVGTDLLLQFAPSQLEFIQVTPGELYANYHEPRLDLADATIRYSGTVNRGTPFSGTGTFATFLFKKLTDDQAVLPPIESGEKPLVGLIWEREVTTDSNVVSIDGTELLYTAPVVRVSGEVLGVASVGIFPENETLQATQTQSGELIFFLVGIAVIVIGFILFVVVRRKRTAREFPEN